MADINTLLGMNLGPEANMQALAQQLRGQQDEGRFLGMSTLAPVAQYGQNLQQGAVNAATKGGALRQSMAKERQAQENYESTALAKTQAAELANTNNAKDSELAHTRRKELAQMAIDAKPQKTGKLKPTGKATEDYLRSKQLMGQIGDVQGLESALTAEQADQLDQPVLDTLSTYLPADIERLAQEKLIYTDPQVKQYRERVADIESEFSKLMSGLAVSGYEMKDRKKWSPYAEGISQESRARRLESLDKKLNDQVGLKEQIYDFGSGGGNSEQVDEEVISQGSRSNDANYEEEREINGLTYGRVGDKWYEL